MPDVACPSIIQQQIWQQVQQLHCSQTAPYELMVADYTGCLQRKRDLEVTALHTIVWLPCLALAAALFAGSWHSTHFSSGYHCNRRICLQPAGGDVNF